MSTTPVDEAVARRRRALRLLRPDVVDAAGLATLQTRSCAGFQCAGVCCRDGAGLVPEEEELLLALAETYAEELGTLGIHEPGVRRVDGHARTSLAGAGEGARCSWLTRAGRCSLQILGELHQERAWAYKPIACVLLPLRVRTRGGARVLTVERRASATHLNAPPCMRYEQSAAPLQGVASELEFVNHVWGFDVPALIAAASGSAIGAISSDEEVIGIVAATKKHVLWALGAAEGVELLKLPRAGHVGDSGAAERSALARLPARWFPQSRERPHDSRSVVRMSLIRGHVPLDLWVRTHPTADEVASVACDLLRAMRALEAARLYQLDLAPHNILIDPRRGRVVLVDLEKTADDDVSVPCAGGSFGHAAPEQYLNYRGCHTRLTESFFIGTIIYRAAIAAASRPTSAFPFSDPAGLPDSLVRPTYALLGDPARFYEPASRLDAAEVLARWEAGTLSMPSFAPRDGTAAPQEPEERWLSGPRDLWVRVHRRGLELVRETRLIGAWQGLVDVAAAPHAWTNGALTIGPLRIDDEAGLHFDAPAARTTQEAPPLLRPA